MEEHFLIESTRIQYETPIVNRNKCTSCCQSNANEKLDLPRMTKENEI